MNTQTREYGTGKEVAQASDSHWIPRNDFSDVEAESGFRSVNAEILIWEFCFHVVICPDEDGPGYYVYAVNLPGAVSQGSTEIEATIRIREALKGLLQLYREMGEGIPWAIDDDPIPADAIEKWIYVNA